MIAGNLYVVATMATKTLEVNILDALERKSSLIKVKVLISIFCSDRCSILGTFMVVCAQR